MKLYAWIALSLVLVSQAFAVTLPYTFTTTLPPSQINANFSALRDATNAHEALRNGHNTRLEDVTTVNNSVGTHPINFNNKELFSARVENLSSDPTCGASVLGKVIWNTTDHLMKVCDGSSFVSIAGSGVNTLASVLTAGNSAGAHDIDLNDNELLNARMENVSGPISPGFAGRIVFNASDNTFYGDDGTNVTAFAGAQGLSSVLTTSNSAGSTNIDFNGNQAVKLRGEQLSSDPGTSYAGRLYYNTTGNKFRFYNGSAWADVGNTNTLANVLALGNTTGSYDLNLNSNELLNAIIQNNVGDPSTGVPGQIWFETGADSLRFGTSGANRTVATLDGSETLTNKSISGSSNTITNVPDSALSSNIPKKDTAATISGAYTFSSAPTVSALKTPSGASHTLTDGLSNDTIVLANAAQTLAGKTLNAPTLSGNLDFAGFQAVNMKLENRTTNPSLGAGKFYYNSNTGELRYSTGTEWRVLTSNLAGSAISLTDLSATAPLLYDNTTGVFSIPVATDLANGYLSSGDHTAFNAKVGSVSVASANGFAGSSSGGTTPALTLSTTITGLLKGNGTAISAATSGTDYAPATSGSSILKGNGAGGFSSAVASTDYVAATSGSAIQKADGSGGLTAATANTDYLPATSGSAIQKADGAGGLTAATSGTDYAPATSGSLPLFGNGSGGFTNGSVTGNTTKVATSTGALTSGNCAKWDASGNIIDAGAACGTGAGASGEITKAISQTTHGFSVGDAIYYNGSAWAKARCDVASTCEALGLVTAVADADNFTVTMAGDTGAVLSGLIPGQVYYVSDVTAGTTSTVEPTTVGEVSKPIMVAYASDSAVVLNMRGQVVTAAAGVGGPGSYNWSGYFGSPGANYWFFNNSGAFADYSVSGSTPSLTQITNNGFGTVTAAGSNLPGISITAPRAGTICIEAYPVLQGQSSGANYDVKLVDGSGTLIDYASILVGQPGTASIASTAPLKGFYTVTNGQAVTFKIQGKTSAGNGYITNANLATILSFKMFYVN